MSKVVMRDEFALFKEVAVYREDVFLFQLILTINITPINIKLCILEKKYKIKSALTAIRSC